MAGPSDVDKFFAIMEAEKSEEKEVLAMDGLIKEMLRIRVAQNRQIKYSSTEVYEEVKRLLRTMSDSEKNDYRDTFRTNVRQKIEDPEANNGPVLTVANDSIQMTEAIKAVKALDAYRVSQQQKATEQQNAEEKGATEEKGAVEDKTEDKGKAATEEKGVAEDKTEEKGAAEDKTEEKGAAEDKTEEKGAAEDKTEEKGAAEDKIDSPNDKQKGKRSSSHLDGAGGPSRKRAA